MNEENLKQETATENETVWTVSTENFDIERSATERLQHEQAKVTPFSDPLYHTIKAIVIESKVIT